jgi:hypothetical protein
VTRALHLSGTFDAARLGAFIRARADVLGLRLDLRVEGQGLRVALTGPGPLIDMAEIALCLGPGAEIVDVRRADGSDPGTPAPGSLA